MELFWENRAQLKAAFCFHQEAPSQMLVRVPNTPLIFRELWVTVLYEYQTQISPKFVNFSLHTDQ